MRCPRCNATITMSNYVFNPDDDEYLVEIYCSECYHNELQEVDLENQPIEDFVEMSLQRIHNSVKHDIIQCFKTGKTYREGLLLEDKNGNRVEVSVITEKWEYDK